MANELNTPTHRWHQPRNNIKLPNTDFSRDTIFDSGVQKIDAWINSQPWGSPVPALFAAGEQGAWYDPSDLTTLFQDSAGTTPVTDIDQPVGLMLDKSGRGNHALQATEGSRPLYRIDGTGRPYLWFDGVDDGFATPSITPGINVVQVFAGLRKLSDAAAATVIESSTNSTTNSGAFVILAPQSASATYRFSCGGTVQAIAASSGFAAPITNVVSGVGDIANDVSKLRVNNTQTASVVTDQGTGNFLAYPLYIGRRGGTSLPFNGAIYGLVVRFGANLDAATINATENWLNTKTGAY